MSGCVVFPVLLDLPDILFAHAITVKHCDDNDFWRSSRSSRRGENKSRDEIDKKQRRASDDGAKLKLFASDRARSGGQRIWRWV